MTKGYTQVPNIVFDNHLPHLSLAELKVLLIIIRQTIGWKSPKTGKQKIRDRISHAYFIRKTGLSRKIISKTIQSLVSKGLIAVSDARNAVLDIPGKRRGKSYIYYSFAGFQPVQLKALTCAISSPELVHKRTHYKRNTIKEKETKENDMQSINEILKILQEKINKTIN